MKKLILIFSLILSLTTQAGVLGDKFKEYSSLSFIAVQDVKEQAPDAIMAKVAIPSAGQSMVSEYPVAVNNFLKSLPLKMRMNKGELEVGEPEVYFSQPTSSSDAEALMIMQHDGIYMITYFLLPPKAGSEFKAEFEKALSK